jgi:MYXO-CTERM domain-containing protein
MVGTSTARNSEPVIRGYLALAGLDTTGAGKTPSVDGTHGQIYDRLLIGDFIPTTAGDWKTSKLYQDGYQILWVPHWAAPGSCSNYSSTSNCTATQYSDADVAATVRTIASFVTDTTDVDPTTAYKAAGLKDLFAECAGLGSFEGVPGNTAYSPTWFTPTQDYTHFHTEGTTPGFAITTGSPSGTKYWGSFGNPLMQIGDFQFRPYSGAIATYKLAPASTYKPPVVRLISEGTDNAKDVFSFIPAESTHGTVVYLGGHSYEGTEGTYLTSGVRLVLNSLFNLGASCVETGITCSTGQLGVCGVGTMTCSGGEPVCTRVTGPSAEICNGLDDDCNGLVDDLPVQTCYDGPAATKNVGLCSEGVRSCVELSPGVFGFSTCQGQQLPVAEVCNGLDDDCDGVADETLSQTCYLGPSSSLDPVTGLPMGECKTGTQTCSAGIWTACLGQVTPTAEACGDGGAGNGIDENCNGAVDEICGCSSGATQPCYGGPTGTAGVGPCKAGTQTCSGSTWGACTGQVVPVAEVCGNGIDDDCNGFVDDDSICKVCPTTPQSCYEGPAGTLDVGVCKAGERTCALGVFGTCGGVVGTTVFTPQVLPSQEICDGLDNNCDGTVDEGPPACATGSQCVNGYCVPDYCDPVEPFIIDGYTCSPTTSKYELAACNTTTCDPAKQCCTSGGCGTAPYGACLPGWQCLGGTCINPCATITCGAGSVCGGGQCTGGSCYSAGCTGTLICKNGGCVADPCTGIYCPSGTFCREGDCVQACTFVSCLEGERCGPDGFCEPDPCAGVSCTSGKTCSAGVCVADPCEGLRCGTGQLCQDGSCVDDPCAYITCPVGVCWRGQCYSSSNPTGAGTIESAKDAGGCGCTSSTPNPGALLLGLLAIPLARRRRVVRPAGPGLLGLVLVTGLAAALAGCPDKTEESTVIDIKTDPANCGGIGNACLAGEICVDGFCGPGTAVAPYIQSLSPTSAAKGTTTPVTVTITGARFTDPMELKVTRPTGVIDTVATTYVDAQHVTASIDVSTDATGILYLRVRDTDLIRSNSRPFDIILESPSVTSITPLTAQAGEVKTLHVSGTGLNATSQCIIGSTSLTDTALPTAVAAGGGLDCTLDTAGISPGEYNIWVRNEGNLTSSKFKLVITSSTSMTLTSLSPSSAKGGLGALIPVTAYGTGFDATCVVYFQTGYPPPAPDAVAQDTTYVSPTELYVAQLDLAPLGNAYPDGLHEVKVHCGSVTSLPVIFTISSSVPEVTLVSPQTAYQGETKVIAFNGTGIQSGAGLAAQIRKLDGTWVDFGTTTWVSTLLVNGTLSLSVGSWPDGEYQVRLKFADGTLSASFPFRILSNTATLRSISPAGGMQGASIPSIAVTGTNFFSGITFNLRTSAGVVVTSIPVLASPAMTSTTASIGPLSLAGRDTGLYQIVAANAGSGASNTLSFSITPGPPTIVGSPSPASAKQSSTPTPVTLTGTNFAKPDASGNGGSQVVAWNTALGITAPIVLPSASVQVVDYDTIIVTLDTLSVVASATNPYTIQVWNPGGATPPQKSNTTTFTVTP